MNARGQALIPRQQTLRRSVRRVRQHRRVPNQERLFTDIAQEVGDRRHPFAADLQSLVAVPALAGRVAMRHAVRKASQPMVAFPPLAGLQALIPKRRQQPRQRRPLFHVVEQQRTIGPLGRIVSGLLMLMGIQPRDDAGQAGTTEAARDIATRKGQALAGKLVQMRRANVRMPHEAKIGPPLIVAENHHDVGWRRRSGQCSLREYGDEQGELSDGAE